MRANRGNDSCLHAGDDALIASNGVFRGRERGVRGGSKKGVRYNWVDLPIAKKTRSIIGISRYRLLLNLSKIRGKVIIFFRLDSRQ